MWQSERTRTRENFTSSLPKFDLLKRGQARNAWIANTIKVNNGVIGNDRGEKCVGD